MPKPQDPTTPTTIYALKDQAGKVFYIGQSVNLKQRLDQHQAQGKIFASVAVLATVPSIDARATEERFIRDYAAKGAKLENYQHNQPLPPKQWGYYCYYKIRTRKLSIRCFEGCLHHVPFEPADKEQPQEAVEALVAEMMQRHPGAFYVGKLRERLELCVSQSPLDYTGRERKAGIMMSDATYERLADYATTVGLTRHQVIERLVAALPLPDE